MNNDTFEVKFIEKDIANVDFIEKEIVQVKLACIDFLQNTSIDNITEFDINIPSEGQIFIYEGGKWVNSTVGDIVHHYHTIEEPTQINTKRFQFTHDAVSGSLQVFLNGIKEKEINIISDKIFEFKIDTIISDIIEVVYIRQ